MPRHLGNKGGEDGERCEGSGGVAWWVPPLPPRVVAKKDFLSACVCAVHVTTSSTSSTSSTHLGGDLVAQVHLLEARVAPRRQEHGAQQPVGLGHLPLEKDEQREGTGEGGSEPGGAARGARAPAVWRRNQVRKGRGRKRAGQGENTRGIDSRQDSSNGRIAMVATWGLREGARWGSRRVAHLAVGV